MEEPRNLAEGLQAELARAREIKSIYESFPTGAFGAMAIEQTIREADAAILSGDVVAMLKSYQDLKDIKE